MFRCLVVFVFWCFWAPDMSDMPILPIHPTHPIHPICSICRLRNSDGWRVFYGWRALRQPCRESRQPCFMDDGAFGQIVEGAMFNFKFWTFWPSLWYHIEIFRANFSIRVYLALNIVLVDCKKQCFRLQKHQGCVFSGEKKPAGLHHTKVWIGDAATNWLP